MAENFKYQALEMILCQNVQSFNLYVRETLIKVFNQHHELLEQDKLNKMESDLQFDNTEAFIVWVVDEKLRVLDYQGFESVLNYLHETIGLDFKVDPAECLYVSEMVWLEILYSIIMAMLIDITWKSQIEKIYN